MAKIQKTSGVTKAAIKRKSAQTLPNNPTEAGYKAADIRNAFFRPITDDENSVLSELDRVIHEVNLIVNHDRPFDYITSVAGVNYHGSYGLIYQFTNGLASIVDYEGSETDLILPSVVSFEGVDYSVVKIGENAFKGKTITNIEISSTISDVGSNAFKDTFLTKVVLNGETNVYYSRFENPTNIEFIAPAQYKSYYDSRLNQNKSLTYFNTIASVKNDLYQEHLNIDTKQDKLKSGTNIQTINGRNILQPGNYEIIKANPVLSGTEEALSAVKIDGESYSVFSESDADAKYLKKTDDYATQSFVKSMLSSVYKVKGSVASYENLPSTKETGDVYNVVDTGMNYVWNGEEWDSLGGLFDISGVMPAYTINSLSDIASIPSTGKRVVYIGGNASSSVAITLPTTVNEIDFNGSTITLEVGNSAEFNVAIIGHAYCTIKNLNLIVNLHLKSEVNYSMINGFDGVENVRVTINKAADSATAASGQIVRGFYSCDHLANCKVEHNFTTANASPQTVAYAYCNYLVWCRLSGYTTFGFAECNYLTNCAVYKGVAESPYYNCNDLTNCTYYEGENQISKSTVSKLTVGGSPLDIIPQFNSDSNSKAYVKPAGGTGIALIEISQSQEDSLSIACRTSDGRLRGKRATSGYDLTPLIQVNEELAKKVDKVTGKGLSTNDFTDTEKTKLAGIETGAEVNEIDTIKAGSNVTVSKSGKTVTISATGGSGGGSDTTVVANPTLTGSETNLSGLQVGDTKYGIKALKVTIW